MPLLSLFCRTGLPIESKYAVIKMRRISQQVYKTQSPMENSSLDKFSG